MSSTGNTVRAWLKRSRRTFRAVLGRAFAALGGRGGDPRHPLDPVAIHSVLVVRVNNRMGNTLFMTPLLAALHESLPHAAIDVLIAYPDAADLLRHQPGLRRVLLLPHLEWRHLGEAWRSLRALRANRYDLVVDPVPNSSSGRVAMLLSRSRWRLGFAGEEQWVALDCAADLPPGVRHEALRPLALVQQAFGFEVVPGRPRLRVANTADELAAGRELLQRRLAAATRRVPADSLAIGFFAMARGQKDLGPEWWVEFWRAYLALRPGTAALEVLPAPDQSPIDPGFATVHCASPRQLAATVAGLDAFFSADTGPMHLASAAGVPTIALFDQTNPAAFGPIKPEDVALPIRGMTPPQVAAACAEIIDARLAARSVPAAASRSPTSPPAPAS